MRGSPHMFPPLCCEPKPPLRDTDSKQKGRGRDGRPLSAGDRAGSEDRQPSWAGWADVRADGARPSWASEALIWFSLEGESVFLLPSGPRRPCSDTDLGHHSCPGHESLAPTTAGPRHHCADAGRPQAPPHAAPVAEPRRTSPGRGRPMVGGSRTGRPPGPQEAPQELGVPNRTAAVIWLIRSLGNWTQHPCPCRGAQGGVQSPCL